MDASRFDRFARTFATRLTRRVGLGLLVSASLPLLGLVEDTDAKKSKKKITLCFNRQTVKKPKKSTKKLLKQGATRGACSCGNGGPCTVFVTSERMTGSEIGGLAGADATCTAIANTAGLVGAYKAWLSDSSQSPATRFDNIDRAGPWILPRSTSDGANPPPTAASSFTDLITCDGEDCLQRAIDRDQNGTTPTAVLVVCTGTFQDGTFAGLDCTGWTTNAGQGRSGVSTASSPAWTDNSFAPSCDSAFRLYCFQQAVP